MEHKLPQRKNIRLKDYDYSSNGLYFITMCTKNRIQILGTIIDDNIALTKTGNIVKKYTNIIESKFDNIIIDEYIIMPNHIHIIIEIKETRNITITRIIKQYKGCITKELGYSIWQKSYYEHIIRNEKEYYKIKEYIRNNIINWNKDKYF